jgi:hypothetical protein
MPETPSIPSAMSRDSVPGLLQRSPSKLAKAFSSTAGGRAKDENGRPTSSGDGVTRSQEEKQALLGRHLNSVEELVKDLRQNTLFGGVVS